jgi:hypothetical protein
MTLREPILLDTAPVAAGELYCSNSRPIVSPVSGTVATLKAALGGSPP